MPSGGHVAKKYQKIPRNTKNTKMNQKVPEKNPKKYQKVPKGTKKNQNIARGTTDPGYWVYNLNQISDWSQFENIIQVTDSIPWVRCASGNV